MLRNLTARIIIAVKCQVKMYNNNLYIYVLSKTLRKPALKKLPFKNQTAYVKKL